MASEKTSPKEKDNMEKNNSKVEKTRDNSLQNLTIVVLLSAIIISVSILISGKIIADKLSSINVLSSVAKDQFAELKTAPLPAIDNYDPTYGNNKDLIIYEYTDYQCPFCARHTINTFPVIYNNYVKAGLATYVYKDFPLESIHPYATISAAFANCVYRNYGIDKYTDFKKWLFENQSEWTNQNYQSAFREKLQKLGVDYNVIETCVNKTEVSNDIEKDLGEVGKYGFTGTPSFLIAISREKITSEEFNSLKDTLDELEAYGLRYRMFKSEDGRYLMIAFSGALPYDFFDNILRLAK